MKQASQWWLPFWSMGLLRLPLLASFLGQQPRASAWPWRKGQDGAWLGWGRKRSMASAKWCAKVGSSQVACLEDGFLRSFGTGQAVPALALVLDHAGIYYDCSRPSALEVLLTSSHDVLSDHEVLVDQALRVLRVKGLSKYNHAADFDLRLLHFDRNDEGNSSNEGLMQRVLVVDQTMGDMSVSLGGASAQTFADMFAAARAENPDATIFVKTHPEVSSGRKGGYLTQVQPDDRTVLLRDAVNPMSLLGHMDKVYVVTSTMGFEALLAGKPVVCFGVPWYAGWGVTDDRCKDSPAWERRTRHRSMRELFAAAYIHYTRYLNPVTHQRGSILNVIDWLACQKEMANRMHGEQRQGRVLGVGFRRWKAANLKPMLGLHRELVQFAPNVSGLEKLSPQPKETLVCWGASPPPELCVFAQDKQLKLLHLEDGFVRSVGLGSDLIRPQSLVLDERGIYFDATRPSDLEHLLANREFTSDDVQRAQQVRAFIVEHGITKYNLEPRQTVQWPSRGRLVVLVPGQVETDASIGLGCTSVQTNLDLLRAVRQARPDAFIVYKPHPDVLSLNRKGRVALAAAREYADHVEAGVSVVSCIEASDEVHTMTSLTGFDALLRGKKVVTYGQPFYAGWGLTEDYAENATAFERRQRRLTLDELVAGALLHYPIYWDWDLKGYTTCEAVLHRIVEQRAALEANGGLHKLRVGFVRRQLRKAKVLFDSWTGRL
ncbi:capsular polysaccharide biosynthesis protein [Limnohabitans sp. INBF002]|uniref:capsular polysaccharide biosynthesis protein n=1 Tax=Limnohabitans sp. INBF002 TaxID=2986280 RepID=UPI0023771D1E|nr:capsular polysaccharide biosynthesis protein [Limnohabitans sp. INBF002]BDU53396.1 capsular polysaccharide export protein [Limnohabitans sp. INBF002]